MIVNPLPNRRLTLGRLGENKVRVIRFDIGKIQAEFPTAEYMVLNRRPTESAAYPVSSSYVTVSGHHLDWTVQSGDLLYSGIGACELVATVDDRIAKSQIWLTEVLQALDGAGTPPAPWQSWVKDVKDAADRAEAAAAVAVHAPEIIEGEWYVWDEDEGDYIATGISAAGQDGYSPSASVTKSGSTATISITDQNGTTTATVSDGDPSAIIDDTAGSGDTGKVWSADKSAELLSALTPLTPSASSGDVGKFLKVKTVADDKVTEYEFGSGGGSVSDVKVNNVSVLDGTVAKIPLASSSAQGVVKVNAGGLQMVDDTIKIAKAQDSVVKAGTVETAPIVPSNQHLAAFYGFAKAAGDTSQASSANAVGSYTDDAKVKIQKMLGIYEAPWELIREDTVTNATETDVEITVDGNGNAYELTDVYMQVWTPQQEVAASIGDYGQVRSYYDSSNYITSQMNTWTQAANAAARYGQVLLKNENGAVLNVVTQNATQYSSVGLIGRTNIPNSDALLKVGTFAFDKIVIKKVTGTVNYKLYGKRKWN